MLYNSSYVGKSARHCPVRWCENLKIQPFRGQHLNNEQEPSAVSKHTMETRCAASFDSFEINAKSH